MNEGLAYDAWKLATPPEHDDVVQCPRCFQCWYGGEIEAEGCRDPHCPMIQEEEFSEELDDLDARCGE